MGPLTFTESPEGALYKTELAVRDRGRKTVGQTDTDRQTDRQIVRQTGRQTDRQTEAGRQIDR